VAYERAKPTYLHIYIYIYIYIRYKIGVKATGTSYEVELDGTPTSRRNSKQAVLFRSTCKVSNGSSEVLTQLTSLFLMLHPAFIMLQPTEVRYPVLFM
jgi:hypothetical protein